MFPHEPERHLVHETIYQAVYRPELGGLCRGLPKALRTVGCAASRTAIPTPAGRGGWWT